MKVRLCDIRESRSSLLLSLPEYGFGICPFLPVSPDETAEDISVKIRTLTDLAELSDIPIDGMVLRFDSFSYSATLGRTGHHYNDGIAFKFEDDTYETVFRSIEWQTGRSGEIAPVIQTPDRARGKVPCIAVGFSIASCKSILQTFKIALMDESLA